MSGIWCDYVFAKADPLHLQCFGPSLLRIEMIMTHFLLGVGTEIKILLWFYLKISFIGKEKVFTKLLYCGTTYLLRLVRQMR